MQDVDWTRQLAQSNCSTPIHLKHWQILCTRRDTPKVMEFARMMIGVAAQMGIMIVQPQHKELQNDRTETFIRNISASFSASVQMVMCIFPSMRDDRYHAVKRLCCLQQPVPSQVVQTRTISNPKRVRSVAQKVVLQMNCKMGGVLWSVNIPLKSLMIVGLDVYHDTTKRMCSVAGVVASLNRSCFTRCLI
uniref:Piwi domain-containing protein n=1 Tax=Eptatretus burgeri TaxID=7764 RepID=A0A8C4WYB8_EPTBU